MPLNKPRVKAGRKIAKKAGLKQNDPLIRMIKKYAKGTGEGNSTRASLARFIKRKRKKQ